MDYLKSKVDQIKAAALGKEIKLYESVGGTEALQDVIVVLAYMQKEYENIIKLSGEVALDDQIANMVIEKKCMEVLEGFKEPQNDVPITADDLNPDWDAEKDLDNKNEKKQNNEEEKKNDEGKN